MQHLSFAGASVLAPALALLSSFTQSAPVADRPASPGASSVVDHYVTLAHARFVDALAAAQALNTEVQAFLREPTAEGQERAKRAWVVAHTVYSHCEVLRFGNPNVDAWEGHVNAWPMDEGLIDYVADGYVFHQGNPFATFDIVHNSVVPIDEELIAEFASGLDPKAAYELRMSDIESNVTTGYHAIEFLLWGQDLPGATPGAGEPHGGRRPHTDYLVGPDCTNGRCDRRRDYLNAAVGRLVFDLRFMARDWQPAGALYARTFSGLPVAERLDRMLVGMGSLSYGELASERIRVALLTGDQEEEQSCFSDTTHLALLHNAVGIETLYHGRHRALDGTTIDGPSLADLLAAHDPELDAELRRRFRATAAAAEAVAAHAEAGEPFDRMIVSERGAGRELLSALVDRLREQAEVLDRVRLLVPDLARP